MTNILCDRTTLDEIAREYPRLAHDMLQRGWVAVIVLTSSARLNTQAVVYEDARGKLAFVTGSRALWERWRHGGGVERPSED